jgi:hypothetical protein
MRALALKMEDRKIDWKRFSIALVAGTFVSSIILGFVHAWSGQPVYRRPIGFEHFPSLALMYFILEVIIVVIVALPTLVTLNRLLWLRGSIVLIIGTLLGAGAGWAIPMLGSQAPPYIIEVLFCAFGGFFAAAIFWLVYAGANKRIKSDSTS